MTFSIMTLVLLCCVSFMLNVVLLSVAKKPLMLSVIMLNVVMLSVLKLNVVAPFLDSIRQYRSYLIQLISKSFAAVINYIS
jgi:hypothetical protein